MFLINNNVLLFAQIIRVTLTILWRSMPLKTLNGNLYTAIE